MPARNAQVDATSTFRLGPGLWNSLPEAASTEQLDFYTAITRETIRSAGCPEPPCDRLRLIAMAGAEATVLLFNSAVYEPSREDLHSFFAQFVLNATEGRSNAITI